MSRSRSPSESNDMEALGGGGMCDVADVRQGVSYDMDGKFSYSQVRQVSRPSMSSSE